MRKIKIILLCICFFVFIQLFCSSVLSSASESKGLEFSAVAVAPKGMTASERYIAYTRALQYLAVVEK